MKPTSSVSFLDNIQQSIDRVAIRIMQQNDLPISDDNVRLNFIESFKSLTHYYFYFDHSDFIYTGKESINKDIFSFNQQNLMYYETNELEYPQQFARYQKPVLSEGIIACD